MGVNSVTVSYLICYDSLLQNVTDIITKCDSYYKMWRLLQIAAVHSTPADKYVVFSS